MQFFVLKARIVLQVLGAEQIRRIGTADQTQLLLRRRKCAQIPAVGNRADKGLPAKHFRNRIHRIGLILLNLEIKFHHHSTFRSVSGL